ncbi:MAG: DUF1674 domain-containing protein [Alphaproteobacteria bacterium]|nr:DUF1674 domain-containing protein [Alphaproteobacteria bacterium]
MSGKKRPISVVDEPLSERRDTTDTSPSTPSPGAIEEVGGPKGPEPTRYGDWERDGRCVDF